MSDLMPVERIESKILLIRGQKVLLDRDLAELYQVSTKAFNQAVKRNQSRFPLNFMFQLTGTEKNELVTNCDRLDKLKYSSVLPYVFTEHGALMSATVLNSERAINVSILIVEAFIRMRELLMNNAKMTEKLKDIEDRMDTQEMNTIIIMDKLRALTNPTQNKTQKIGFDAKK
ncbi:MAG: ORF6N domain-containing protein [Victivallaceae bacterium]